MKFHQWKRRDFITVLGGAAMAWPPAAVAQPRERMRSVGVLMNLASNDMEGQTRLAAFLQGLQEAGWGVGRNIRIEIRWAAGDAANVRKYVAELVELAPDVVLAYGGSVVGAFQQASRTLPIVFVNTTDPVGGGYVSSLAQPGGNTTGFTMFEYSIGTKWLELLKQIAPSVKRAAALRDPGLTSGIAQFAAIQSVASLLAVELRPVDVRNAV